MPSVSPLSDLCDVHAGVPVSNVVIWRKPEERRRLSKASAQKHAQNLLRIDKASRKKGKYASMERTLFARFRARRDRGRKTSGRWVTHTARKILRDTDPEAAAKFKGAASWQQRWRRRFNIAIRRKTNCKNKAWEDSKPKLQR